jgi:hypothetical protein
MEEPTTKARLAEVYYALDMEMQRDRYLGWTNRETWVVNLWLTNDEGTELGLRTIAQLDYSLYGRADLLENMVKDIGYGYNDDGPLLGACMFTDLLRGALDRVNWSEIIENHQEDDKES